MKAFCLEGAFGLNNIKIKEVAQPEPGEGEILIKLKAASLNYRDVLMAEGKYNPRLQLPVVPLSDGVGEVVSTGAGVDRFKEGERVCPIFALNWLQPDIPVDIFKHTLGGPLDGTLRQYMVTSQDAVVKVPEYLSDAEAATLPCAALTAFNSIVTFGQIQKGQVVLVLGTGGVSIFATQIALAQGAEVIVTSSNDEKLERAGVLGAQHLINYNSNENWHKQAREITGGRGVDLVVEVGGAGTLEKSIKSVKNGGHISLIGILAGSGKDFNLLPILMRNIRVQGILVGCRDDFEQMNQMFAQHQIKPVVDQTVDFESSLDAFNELKSGSHFGKVCIKI